MGVLQQGRGDAVGQAQLRMTPSHNTVWNPPSRSTLAAGLASGALQHQRLQKHPTPGWFTVRAREGHCPTVPGHGSHSPGAIHTALPSPRSASATDVLVASLPLCLKGSHHAGMSTDSPLLPPPEASRATPHHRVKSHLQSIWSSALLAPCFPSCSSTICFPPLASSPCQPKAFRDAGI